MVIIWVILEDLIHNLGLIRNLLAHEAQWAEGGDVVREGGHTDMRHTPSSFYVRGYWAPTPTSPPSPGQYIYQTRSRGQLVETLQSFVYLLGDRKQFSGQCVWETLQHICLSSGGSRMKSVGNTGICVSSQGQLSDAFSGQVWEKHCKHMSLLGSDVSLLGSRTCSRIRV